MRLPATFAVPLLALALAAQAPFPAGYRDATFPNTTGQGTASLAARVYYPATAAGANQPVRPQAGGYPVLVFLHGFAALGRLYGPLGTAFAEHGCVAVLLDTAQFSGPTLTLDGIAMHGALAVANQQAGHFLQGALDLQRMGVAGHSMGGGSTIGVLARNPGYRCGLGFAPVDPGAAIQGVRVPLGVIHGQGDTIVPPASGGLPWFQNAAAFADLSFLYLLNQDANHTNVCGFLLATQADQEVFARCMRVALGFFDRAVRGIPQGLEEVVGGAATSEPRLQQLSVRYERPQLWNQGAGRIGTTPVLRLGQEPGAAFVLVAAGTASLATPFGILELDPASLLVLGQSTVGSARLVSLPLPIPNDPGLLGAVLPLQGLGEGRGGLRLGNLLRIAFVN
ncbi:MAG: hypothetical protein IT458_18080 [Planctomycetes bacterium]|nr:hypothetical protein [Planctomycetota bacterium]